MGIICPSKEERKKGKSQKSHAHHSIGPEGRSNVDNSNFTGACCCSKAHALIRGARLDLLKALVESAGDRPSASRGAGLIVATGTGSRSRGCVCWGELGGSVQVFGCGANSRA